MRHGYSFIAEEDAHPKINPIRFYYSKLKDNEDNEILYPIYLTFNDDRINFIFKGFIRNEKQPEGRFELVETDLFSLHVTTDEITQGHLNNTLAHLFEERFPIKKEYYLYKCEYGRGNNTFTSTEVINHLPSPKYDIEDEREIKQKIDLRDLVLDFLFDIQYSNVFDLSPEFSKLKQYIKNSPIFQALLAKADFYYNISKIINDKTKSFVYSFDNNQFVKDYKSSFKTWVNVIKEPHANHVINEGHNWFKDVETEMSEALNFYNESIKIGDINPDVKFELKKEEYHLKEHTSSWFINRNNILKAWMNNGLYEKLFFLIFLVLNCYLLASVYLHIYNKTFASDYYINILNPEECIPGIPTIYLLAFLPLILTILVFLFRLFISICDQFIDIYKKHGLKLLKLYKSFRWKKIKTTHKIYASKQVGLFKYFMFPLWALIFGATHIVFTTGAFYNKDLIKNQWTYELSTLFLILLSIVAIILSINSTIKILKKKKKQSYLLSRKSKNVMIFKLVLLCVMSLIFIGVGVYLYYVFDFSGNSLLLFLVLILILFGVLLNHERESHPKLNIWTSFYKTCSMLFYGLIISFYVNLFYINTEYKEYLETYEYLGHIWHHTYKVGEGEGFAQKITGNNDTLQYIKPSKSYEFGYKLKLQNKDKDSISNYDIKLQTLSEEEPKNNKHIIKKEVQKYVYLYKRTDKVSDEYEKVKKAIYQPLSDDIEVTIDKVFFEQLQFVYSLMKNNKGDYVKSKVPILKKININGINITIIPSILFINIFLSLFIAVILQIFINKNKFLKGGSGHGH